MTSTAGRRPPGRRGISPVTRDRAITGILVAVLAVAAFAIALPRGGAPGSGEGSQAPGGAASSSPSGPTVYREGVVGRPMSITPVTARNRADRTLVGLIYSGLVKLGPDNTLVPDLAASWTVDKSGQTWTVAIRPDAAWQDGQPVTADDVVYTVAALKDPSAAGGLAAAWADVTVQALDAKTVRFTLGSPVGGFLGALTQPLLPSHLLTGVPMSDLATGDFSRSPVGSGPYQLVQLDDTRAVLVPAGATAPAPTPDASAARPSADASASGAAAPSASSSASSGADASTATASAGAGSPAIASAPPSVASAAPSGSAAAPSPSPTATPAPDASARPVERIEVTFYDTEAALAAAFQAGEIDGAAGLSAATTKALASTPGASVLDYPTTTLSAILLNLRPTHPELADPNVRKALLGAVNRAAIAASDLGGQARVADTLIPPESWAYDPAEVTKVGYDQSGAAKLLKAAGWTRSGGKWTAPKAKKPYAIELLTVPADVNPRLAAVAEAVRQSWTTLGITVTVTPLSGTALAARLKTGDFGAVLLDIESGLEPDLYPLLDSSQVRANGSNRSGYQDPALDKLLEAARQPGTVAERQAAWSALLAGLSARLPVLPIVWADEQVVVRGLSGASPRLIVHTGDRYWDVLAWRLAASR